MMWVEGQNRNSCNSCVPDWFIAGTFSHDTMPLCHLPPHLPILITLFCLGDDTAWKNRLVKEEWGLFIGLLTS